MSRHWFELYRHFVLRDLKQRYLGSLSGGLWALLQPLILLGVYSVVFVEILKVRLPGSENIDIVPFLVAALWPWTAFAESLMRSVTTFPENAGLLSKVAMPRELLVLSPVSSTFLLHFTGFVAVVALLAALGKPLLLTGLPLALLVWVLLFFFAIGLAFVFASVQVFVRDLSQVLGQVLMLWFYLTPVFYSRDMVPARFAAYLNLNPLTAFVETIRAAILPGSLVSAQTVLIAAAVAAGAMLIGVVVFRRLARHFEDYL
jgi:lipopolysaccharide transport system permease protein